MTSKPEPRAVADALYAILKGMAEPHGLVIGRPGETTTTLDGEFDLVEVCRQLVGAAAQIEQKAIVEDLARYLHEVEERADPGMDKHEWSEESAATRAFYTDVVWAFLTRTKQLTRFLELAAV